MEAKIYKWMKNKKKPASLKHIQRELRLSPAAAEAALEGLVKKGKLVRSGSTRYTLPGQEVLVPGSLRIDRHGRMQFHTEDGRRFRVSATGTGRHDDLVQCRILPRRGNTPAQAEVRKVTEQAHEVVTGRYTITDQGAVVECLDARLGTVRVTNPSAASDGDLVSVRITSVPAGGGLSARGVVESVLGNGNDAIGYLRAIAVNHGIRLHFDEDVLAEAEALPDISEKDLAGREDLRLLTTFTIDGADAKDLDDAVSLEVLKDGTRRLGVHIADVSHYVRAGGALDRESYRRGNSTYLPGLTIPMLPERLSNGLCSLWPDGDKLTLSAILDFDRDGNLTGHRIVRSVIRSNARLTYGEVQEVLDGGNSGNAQPFKDMLLEMEDLRAQLKKARTAAGALDFDLPEPRFVLNCDGWPERIEKRFPTRATQLIEEFMLAANRTVATTAAKEGLPIVYRAHPVPDQDKTDELWRFLATMGYSGRGASPTQFQRIIRAAEGKPEEHVVNYAILRAMQKAIYTDTNEGHFGLAFTHYCHFTSPIRRYSDLVTHRALKAFIEGGGQPKATAGAAKRCTQCEIASMESEREAHDLMKAQFMRSRLGEVYDGVISGVTGFGIFVELDNTVEGLVHITGLGDDYYVFDEAARALVGERTGKRYVLGQPVRVQVAAVKLAPPSVDFVLHE